VTLVEAVNAARLALLDAGLSASTAALDADLLARHATGWDHADWLARRHRPADAEFVQHYGGLVDRRVRREPVAYIRGVQEFWGRDFLVTSAVLIPRSETELLVETATVFLARRPNAVVVDVGTGSGCVAISLALEHPSITMLAVEISAAALQVSQQNAARHRVGDRVRFVHGAFLEGTPRPLDLIVANPPYVAERDRPALSPEVKDYEPAVALFGGDDGWRDIRTLLGETAAALAPEGRLMMEIGYRQIERIAAEVEAVDRLQLLEVRNDLQGIPRVVVVGLA